VVFNMSVYYKFKSEMQSKELSTIFFDGAFISVPQLKIQVIQQRKLGKLVDQDLEFTNAQTLEVYAKNASIPKNTTLIVTRKPTSLQMYGNALEGKVIGNITEKRLTKSPSDANHLSKSDVSYLRSIPTNIKTVATEEEKSPQNIAVQAQAQQTPDTFECLLCRSISSKVVTCVECDQAICYSCFRALSKIGDINCPVCNKLLKIPESENDPLPENEKLEVAQIDENSKRKRDEAIV